MRDDRRPLIHVLDVTSEEAWEQALGATVAEFDGLDVFVNCAGVLSIANTKDETLKNWSWQHCVNLDGVFLG